MNKYYFIRILLMTVFWISFNYNLLSQIYESKVDKITYSTIVGSEMQYIDQAYSFLCNEFINKYYKVNDLPNIHLTSGFRGFNEEIVKLKYDNNRIAITVLTENKNSEIILKLLDYTIKHLSKLKTIGTGGYSLKKEMIDSIIRINSSPEIISFLNQQVYRELKKKDNKLEQTYFLKNDTFCFYTNEMTYLKLNTIFQIVNIYYLGNLIFDTDSTFYYYNTTQEKLSKKFTLTNKEKTLFHLVDYDDNLKRILFELHVPLVGQSGIKKEKFLFLANENLLIDNYDQLEDTIIKNYLEKNYHR